MSEREVVSVLWHKHGHHIHVAHTDGYAEHLVGSEAFATQLARMAGLRLADADDHTVRWSREADIRQGRIAGP